MVGLLGHKLKHSLSKQIHELIVPSRPYQMVEKESIVDFMEKKEFSAINVTIPYKETVIPFCQELDPLASILSSVNTITNKNGVLKGYNTDYQGFLDMLGYEGVTIEHKTVIILGNGATASMVDYACKNLQAKQVKKIVRTMRSTDELLVGSLERMEDVDIIINTTPVGMYPSNYNNPFVDLKLFPNATVVIDIVYNPLKTKLLQVATSLGKKAINGLYMLVAQAFYAEEIFLNKRLDPSLILSTYQTMLYHQTNIVLIGMPTSGKTTIGKLLSYDLKRPFYDIDQMIEETFGNISSIFAEKGELAFREYETLTIAEVAKYQGVIISTGGGVIKNKKNIDYLSQNGIIVFINRTLDRLMESDVSNRPLLKSSQDIKTLFLERHQLYLDYCDILVDNNSTFSDVITKIKENVYEATRH